MDKAFSQEQVHAVVRQIQAAGINVIGNYIFGLPEDDRATMRATLDMALELKCEFANFYSAMAYPGSPLYDVAVRSGVPLPRRWSGYSQHSRDCLPLPTRYLPAHEVLRFRDEAFAIYFTDPGYLDMVRSRFGENTKRDILHMLGQRLERDLLTGALDVPRTLLPSSETSVRDHAELLQLNAR